MQGPHCNRDTETVYVNGLEVSKENAVAEHHRIQRQLNKITANNPNLFTSFAEGDAEKKFKQLLSRANELEVALGY